MSTLRQQVLIMYLATSDLASPTVAWALYDGASPARARQMQTGDSPEPPYASVLEAMRDGWNLFHMAALPTYLPGHEHETGHLPYEYALERKVAADG